MVTDNIGIDKLRKCKRKLEKINKIILSYTDMEPEEGFIESDSLYQMLLISQVNDLLTDVIYYIIDNVNLEKQ